jgi:DNA recombination protein RmuC
MNVLLAIAAVAAVAALPLLVVLLWRTRAGSSPGLERSLRDELRAGRDESATASRDLRGEVAAQMKAATDTLVKTVGEMGATMSSRLRDLTDGNEQRLEKARATLDERLRFLQESNEKRLEAMRQTVDERLQTTLEKRLGESFRIVSENLEAVQKGLGEMQNLAAGVGDLKRVLTNVKTRGTWGEVQLGAILEEILTPDQFARNVQTREGSREAVEYAVRLPGREGDGGAEVLLPIDAKFPQEDYLRVLQASENGNGEAVEAASAALARSLHASAKEIHDKYLNPPVTTDFGIMFLPTEGLYAEILRRPGAVEELQRRYRIVVAGPTTLAALLNSLRMGFRTIAIEKRTSEVWKVLGAVKTEFAKFGEILDRVKRQLDTAATTLEETGQRTRAMERRLRSVEELPSEEAEDLLGLGSAETADETDEAR